MSTAKAGMRGHAPKAVIQPAPKKEYKISGAELKKLVPQLNWSEEQKKYIKCWEVDAYRKLSPGEQLVDSFLEAADPKPGATIIDWGCGTGRAGYKLYQKGYDVTLVDFAYNCLDEHVKEACKNNDRLRFVELDLSKKVDISAEYGFCCDVLEHINGEEIDIVIDHILHQTKKVFFQISTVADGFGAHPDIGEPLHLTVHGYQWWLEKFASKKVVIYRSNDLGNAAVFFLTGWGPYRGTINVDRETIVKNIIENSKLGLKQVVPHEQQEEELMILAGGPSLNDFEDEIIQNRKNGMKVITLNGSYQWALDRNLDPVNQIMIDARPHNKRFVEEVRDGNLYFIASQCDPSVFENLPKDRTYIWHVSIDEATIPVIKEHYGEMHKDWYPCPGGSSVTTRALCLLMMLGFYKFHIYGFDSCYLEGKHHAYEQPENDNQTKTEITVAKGTPYAKTFSIAPWHHFQAKDFQDMVPRILKDAKLDIKGDGLIAYMLKVGAELSEAA